MPNPTRSDVHVNGPLTNISVAYIQDESKYFADKVFPVVPVKKQSDEYSREDMLRIVAQERAVSSESAGGGYDLDSTPNYSARKYSVHKDIDEDIRANADQPLDPDRDATIWVTQQLLMLRDKKFAAAYMTTGVWGTDREGVAAAPAGTQFLQWNDATSTPIEDVSADLDRIEERTGFRPNVFCCGARVWTALKNHPDIIDRIKYTQKGIVTKELVAALFEVDKLVVMSTIENTANKGATASYSYMVGKVALLVYAAPNPSLMQPTGGYIFAWTGLLGSGAFGMRIKKMPVPLKDSDRVEGDLCFDMKLVSAPVGVFYATAVA
jgi:hypothetical protein